MAEWKKIIVSGSGVAQLANDANYLTDYTVTSGDVTAHEGDITITESQISDFGTYSTATGVENNADVTDFTNVQAAGALMDTEVDADIKTLSLPANTTISTFGASLVDDANATAAQTTLGLGSAALEDKSAFATAAQGNTADNALQDISGESVTDLTDVSSAGSGQIITAAERGSIGALNTFTGSLDANFATDAELSAVSGALALDISGALMDSEVTNLAQVKSFDSSDYATAAQGIKADNAFPGSKVSTFGATLVDDVDAGTARATLGLGTAAIEDKSTFATAAQGGRADTALQDISGESVTDLTDVSSAGSGQIITAAERGSIGALNTFTGSLNANFATDAELAAVSGALASDLSSIDTAVPAIVDNSGTPAFNSGITKTEVLSILNVADGAEVNVGTNITISEGTNTVEVQSSTGNNDTIAAATTSAAGVMTSSDKSKLDGIDAGAEVNVDTNITVSEGSSTVEIQSSTGTNDSIAAATTSAAGVMTAADKSKLDGIETGAEVTSTAKVKSALNANLGTLTIGDSNDVITIGNDLVVTGDLTVSGDTTTIDVANLNVTDQFINLNDGGVAADGGLVVEGAGVSFGWDNSEARWAFDAAGATEGQTAITADAYASAVVTSDLAAYRKNGNIRVDGGEIYIYTE